MEKKIISISVVAVIISITIIFGQTKKIKKMSNKELVTTAVTALFINGDTTAIDKYWSEDYTQHNPNFPNGREVIYQLFANQNPNFKYEMGLVAQEGDFVILHGRYQGFGPNPMIVVDIFKVKNQKIVEHWDVMQEEISVEKTVSKNPMFPIL